MPPLDLGLRLRLRGAQRGGRYGDGDSLEIHLNPPLKV
jgi:hypothetical protein